MQVGQGGGSESYPAEGVRRRCMKNSPSVLSCIRKRTREGCDRDSESLDNSQRVRQGRTSSSEETEVIWQERESCEKEFVSKNSECV